MKLKFTLSQIFVVLILAVLVINTPAQAKKPALELIWSIDNKFSEPESATLDKKRNVIYLSNVNGYAKDNNGFISRISTKGEILDLKWIAGIHSPTGMAIYRDHLFFADYDALVKVDLETGKITARYEAPDARDIPMLNDVAIASDGTVYVTGSKSRKIYRFEGTKLEAFIKDNEKLKNANGLFVEGNTLIHGGKYWTAFNRKTGVELNNLTTVSSKQMFDGISGDGQKGYYFTIINDGRFWHMAMESNPEPISQDIIKGIDFYHDVSNKVLFIPRVGNTLSAYKIRE